MQVKGATSKLGAKSQSALTDDALTILSMTKKLLQRLLTVRRKGAQHGLRILWKTSRKQKNF